MRNLKEIVLPFTKTILSEAARRNVCLCLRFVFCLSYDGLRIVIELFLRALIFVFVNTFKCNLCLFFQFRLMLSQDESGKGAALVAAFAKKKLQKNNNSF